MSRFGAPGGVHGAGGAEPNPLRELPKPPVAILVEPQLGENIGMVARAMGNFGWRVLRLVRPRDGWPSAKATATASSARAIVENAQLFETLDAALADLTLVYATSARKHDLVKPVIGPAEAAASACGHLSEDDQCRVGYVFGREAWGLTNDEVALCDDILTLPVDPQCASLNISQAALVCAYEWRRHASQTMGRTSESDQLPLGAADRGPLATKAELIAFFEHLEGLLDERGFFHPPEKRDRMVRNLRSIYQRPQLTAQEVRTLRGVLASLDRVHERS
ncbi:MAG: RNA methyltransferase [Pseudomonadota bacterium]